MWPSHHFFISELRLWGAFSQIHLLSIWTLFSLVMAVYFARQGNYHLHKIWMVLLYILALLGTGVFTLWPGRVMHGVLFGVQYPVKDYPVHQCVLNQ